MESVKINSMLIPPPCYTPDSAKLFICITISFTKMLFSKGNYSNGKCTKRWFAWGRITQPWLCYVTIRQAHTIWMSRGEKTGYIMSPTYNSGRPSIGRRYHNSAIFTSSSLLLKWLFFVALIICCRQIFVCLIFVGRGPHENFSVYGSPIQQSRVMHSTLVLPLIQCTTIIRLR